MTHNQHLAIFDSEVSKFLSLFGGGTVKNDPAKSAESNRVHQKTAKIKLFFFWCLLVIISLVAMELLSFSVLKLTKKKGTYRDRVVQVDNPFHPYLGYVHAPNIAIDVSKGLSRKMSIATDENGYSITPSYSHINPDITIIVTGGSTMFGVGSSENSTTVPSILERIINQRLNIRAEVVNLALRGGQSFQEMLLVDRFLAENHADLVLSISGRNDAFHTISDPTVEGAFLNKHIWENAVPLVHRVEREEFTIINLNSKLRSLSFTFDLLSRWINGSSRSKKSRSSAESSTLNLRRDALTTSKNRAKITATHYAATDQISKMNGANFVMVLQPTLYYKNIWTESEVSRMKGKYDSENLIEKYRQNEHEFYDAFRKEIKPFQFIDLSNIFLEDNETLYIDQCHYNDLGAEKLAEKVLESIQPLLNEIRDR